MIRNQELVECLTQESGLPIYTEQSAAAQQGTVVKIQVTGLAPEDCATLYLAWAHPAQPDPLLLHLLQALAHKIYLELLVASETNQAQVGSWEWLMQEGEKQQWDSAEFSGQATHFLLPPLVQGFPLYILCTPWHVEIPKVIANLYPQAQVHWYQEPALFLWLPVGIPNSTPWELKTQGEALIQEVYSLLADELGVSSVVLVGQPSQNNIWGGYQEVKELAGLHARFFAGEPGLTAWKLELADLVRDLNPSSAMHFQEKLLGALSKELLETLIIFLEHDLSLGDTAKALYIHRNTLNYRLDRITELTGSNPRQLTSAVYFYLAVWLKKHGK